MSVTVATSHWLRSPLKAEADSNTVARKEGTFTFTVNAQEKKAEWRTLIKKLWQPKEGKHSSKLHVSLHQPKPPSKPPWITRACSGQKEWNIIRILHKNITISHKPHTLLQWAMRVHSFYIIFTSHHHHQPKSQAEPSYHNSISSHHVKSFFTIHIDLLYSIVVTFATSHWLRSPLKAV